METRDKLFFAGLLLMIVIAGIFLVKGKIQGQAVNEGNAREIIVNAKMFEFDPSEIRVKQGEAIKIKINNLDVEHSIYIPELDVNIHGEGEFIAEKKGIFEFQCHTYCGKGHENMKGALIVE